MDNTRTDNKTLKDFSRGISTALFIAGTLFLAGHKQGYLVFYPAAVLFFFAGILAAPALRPVYLIWMRLAFVLSWINTRLLLSVMFYLVLTPTGLVIKLMGKDILDQKIEKAKRSYWLPKPGKAFQPAEYEKQF